MHSNVFSIVCGSAIFDDITAVVYFVIALTHFPTLHTETDYTHVVTKS